MPVWKQPPIIKVYEALGCLADGRLHQDGNTAKVYSSSGQKYYTVTYDPNSNSIMCNDNGSYWHGYLGYPAIAYLLKIHVIPYSESTSILLKDIKWKDLNQQYNNDFAQTAKYCQNLIVERGGDLRSALSDIQTIYDYLTSHPLNYLGSKIKPPSGY